MKCNQCGTEFEGKFCPECGTKAEAKTPISTPQTQNQTEQHTYQQPIQAAPIKPAKKKKPFFLRWWFILLVIVAIGAVAISVGGGGKKIDWDDMVLGEMLPEPPSNKGTLYENSEEQLWVSLDGVSDDQYNDYLDACIDTGFTVDEDKSSYSYKAYNSDGYSLDMSHIGENLSINLEAPMELGSITWPSSTVGNLLPAPKSTTGKFSYEHDDSFFVYIGNTSKADYDQYVADCSANGFTVDYDKGDTYYRADNADGYHISLTYKGNNIMTVEIKAPKNDEASTSDPATTEPSTTESSTSPETTESNTDTNVLRSDFKEAMDSYENFMDEYVAFMKKYKDNPSDAGLLADYASYMSKYADMVEKFDKWESEDLTDAELAYYIDVQTRVSKKLLEVAN